MLYIFDLDGTLVKTYGTQPLPNVFIHLKWLESSGHKMAEATNQAGLAWRIWTNDPKFPTAQSLAHRFEQITLNLPTLQSVQWFVSLFDSRIALSPIQYQCLVLDLVNAKPALAIQASVVPEWRKPQPGMLLAAGEYYDLDPDEIIFVGDYDTDAEAAASAGIQFFWAEDFFSS